MLFKYKLSLQVNIHNYQFIDHKVKVHPKSESVLENEIVTAWIYIFS